MYAKRLWRNKRLKCEKPPMQGYYSHPEIRKSVAETISSVFDQIAMSPVLLPLLGQSDDIAFPEVVLHKDAQASALAEYSPQGDIIRYSIPRLVGNPTNGNAPLAYEQTFANTLHELIHRKQFRSLDYVSILLAAPPLQYTHATLLFEVGAFVETARLVEELRRQGDTRLSDFYRSTRPSTLADTAIKNYLEIIENSSSAHMSGQAANIVSLSLLFGHESFTSTYISNALNTRLSMLSDIDQAITPVIGRGGNVNLDARANMLLYSRSFDLSLLLPLSLLSNGNNYLADPEDGTTHWVIEPGFMDRFLSDQHRTMLKRIEAITKDIKSKLPTRTAGLQSDHDAKPFHGL